MNHPFLTIIVPVYNEERTVAHVLQQLHDGPYAAEQVIVVDDGSTDATAAQLDGWRGHPNWLFLRHERNCGKGAAVRTGLVHARGWITVIQDADLEYDPADLPRVVEPIHYGSCAIAYGSRYLRPMRRLSWNRHRLAVTLLNLLVRLLYGQRLTDEATCYKAVRTDLLRAFNLQAEGFELCAEITAKACRRGVPIHEIAISYQPRSIREGKKIRCWDAFLAVWTLLKWRLPSFNRAPFRAAVKTP